MPIPFTCPHCGAEFAVADRHAGQVGPCARCGQSMTIPFLDGGHRSEVSTTRHKPVALLVLALLLLVGLAVGGVARLRSAWRRYEPVSNLRECQECQANLRRIGQALAAYHAEYGQPPPAVVYGADGLPRHSWRVLLLPYLGHQQLHDRYDFGLPWNSEGNLELATEIPPVYICPAVPQVVQNGETHYFALLAEPGASQPGSQVTAVGESMSQASIWTAPTDIPVTEALEANGSDSPLNSNHIEDVHVLLPDGSLKTFREGELLVPGHLNPKSEARNPKKHESRNGMTERPRSPK